LAAAICIEKTNVAAIASVSARFVVVLVRVMFPPTRDEFFAFRLHSNLSADQLIRRRGQLPVKRPRRSGRSFDGWAESDRAWKGQVGLLAVRTDRNRRSEISADAQLARSEFDQM